MTTAPVYQLKVSLLEIEPAVWRRLQVEGSLTLERLHTVIQKAMGWQNAHVYEFVLSMNGPQKSQTT